MINRAGNCAEPESPRRNCAIRANRLDRCLHSGRDAAHETPAKLKAPEQSGAFTSSRGARILPSDRSTALNALARTVLVSKMARGIFGSVISKARYSANMGWALVVPVNGGATVC